MNPDELRRRAEQMRRDLEEQERPTPSRGELKNTLSSTLSARPGEVAPAPVTAEPDELDRLRAEHRAHEGEKKCPDCAEWIKAEARVCRFCNWGRRPQPSAPQPSAPRPRRPEDELSPEVLAAHMRRERWRKALAPVGAVLRFLFRLVLAAFMALILLLVVAIIGGEIGWKTVIGVLVLIGIVQAAGSWRV